MNKNPQPLQIETPIEMPSLLTAAQVAKILHVSTKTLEVWRRTRPHELQFLRIHRAIRYHPRDVMAFQEMMRVGIKSN